MCGVRSRLARSRSRSFAVIAGGLMLVAAGSSMAAVNAYLVVDGIDGPSAHRLHAIDVLSFSEGVSVPVSATRIGASGAGAGKVSCGDLAIEKVLDAASVPLVQAAFTGLMIPKVQLIYTKPIGDKETDYFTLTLSSVVVTSVQESGTNENPTESVSFTAKTLMYSFTPQKPDGSLGTPIVFSGNC
jgi:type VI secretion system Hcp family effector